MTDEEFAAFVRQQTLDAFSLEAWQIDPAVPAPWHERLRGPFRRMRYRLRIARLKAHAHIYEEGGKR